jgi:hypothetical protein
VRLVELHVVPAPDASDFDRVVARLCEIGFKAVPDEDSSSSFLTTGREEARRLGQLIHDHAGYEGMVRAITKVHETLGPDQAEELNAAWDGVGVWQW